MNSKINTMIAGATLIAGAAVADIQLSDGDMPDLKISGWIDFNYVDVSTDNGTGLNGGDVETLSLNEVEIDFMFDFGGGLTAQFDLQADSAGQADFSANSGIEDVELEQAFFTYDFLDGEDSSFSVTAGRFLSYMGWESADLVNLYQFSYGYASNIAGYQDGVRLDYASDMFAVGVGILDGVWTTDKDHGELRAEFMVKFTGVENLTVFAGYSWEDGGAGDDPDAFDVWASYQIGDLLLAAEYSTSNDVNVADEETDSFLVMANYSVNDWLGFTARFSTREIEVGGTTMSDTDEFTLAALLAVHDNLGIIIEYRHDEENYGTGDESDQLAVEATLTF